MFIIISKLNYGLFAILIYRCWTPYRAVHFFYVLVLIELSHPLIYMYVCFQTNHYTYGGESCQFNRPFIIHTSSSSSKVNAS